LLIRLVVLAEIVDSPMVAVLPGDARVYDARTGQLPLAATTRETALQQARGSGEEGLASEIEAAIESCRRLERSNVSAKTTTACGRAWSSICSMLVKSRSGSSPNRSRYLDATD